MRKPKILAALILFGLLPAGAAAAADYSKFQIGLSFSPSLPQGGFRDALDHTIWGGSLSFTFRPSRGPLLLGTSLGIGAYGSSRWQDWLGLTDPDVLVDVRSTNAIVTWNVFLRLQPMDGTLRPYLDIFAGLHFLSTDTKIGNDDGGDGDGYDSSINNSSDTTFAYGVGAGVMFPVIRFVRRDGRTAGRIDVDLGVRYTKGGRAEFLVETGIPGVFDTRFSRTDLLTLSAGLAFSF
jgi:hypothetical protein